MERKRIKILYTIPNFETAGSGKVVYDLVKNIDKNVFEPHICCFHRRGTLFKELEKLDLPIHIFSFAIHYRPFGSFPFRLIKIVRFFKKHQFDFIHSWHWSSDFSEPLAAKLAGIPFVYTKKNMGWGNRAWKWRSILSTKIIAVNTDMKSQFFNNFKDKIVEMPLGIDTQFYAPQKKTYRSPEGLAFNHNDFVIVSVANLLPIKGVEILLQAVKELKDNRIKVLIVGSNNNKYGELLMKKYSSGTVYFVGKKLDVRPYLCLSDVFVISSLDLGEGLPIAPIEAMSFGCVVFGSNVSGVKDILREFPQYLFEPNNVNELKYMLQEFISLDIEQRKKLQLKMRNVVLRDYSNKKFVEGHTELYKSLIV